MPKMLSTTGPAAAQVHKKGCGCGGHREGARQKLPADAQERPGPSTHNKQVHIKHTTDHSGCCCGDEIAS